MIVRKRLWSSRSSHLWISVFLKLPAQKNDAFLFLGPQRHCESSKCLPADENVLLFKRLRSAKRHLGSLDLTVTTSLCIRWCTPTPTTVHSFVPYLISICTCNPPIHTLCNQWQNHSRTHRRWKPPPPTSLVVGIIIISRQQQQQQQQQQRTNSGAKNSETNPYLLPSCMSCQSSSQRELDLL